MGKGRRNDAPDGELNYAVVNLDRGAIIATRVCIAGTSRLRRKGLLGIESLGQGAGLWIAPCEAIHTFGMRMPIDVIFLDHDLRVRKVTYALSPRRISGCLRAFSALELAAGAIEASGTRIGDYLSFQSRERSDREKIGCK